MKTLNQMDETEFLRRCWLIADAVSDLLTKTKVMDLRKVMPVFNGSETEEEKKQKREEQSRKNLKAMAKSLLFENAEATAKLLPLLYEPDVDENGVVENIGPFKKMRAVKELLNNDDVLDFLLWCLPLVLAGTDA